MVNSVEVAVSESISIISKLISTLDGIKELGRIIEYEITKVVPGVKISILHIEPNQEFYPEFPIYRSNIEETELDDQFNLSLQNQRIRSPIRENLIGKKVIIEQSALFIEDIYNDIFVDSRMIEYFETIKINSLIYLPLITANLTFGYLAVWKSDNQVLKLDNYQLEFLKQLSLSLTQIINTFVSIEVKLEKGKDYFNFINQAKDIVFTRSLDGYFIYINDAVFDILGYKPEELIGQPIDKLIPTHGKYLIKEEIQHKTPKTYIGVPRLCKDGEIKYLDFSIWMSKSSTGEDIVQGIARDVDELVQVNDKLWMLNQAIDSSTNMIIILNTQYEIEFINQEAIRIIENILGYPKGSKLGKPISNFLKLNGDKIDGVPQNIDDIVKAMESSHYWFGEISLKDQLSNIMYFNLVFSKTKKHNGENNSYLMIFDDITEKKQLELEMIANVRLESLGAVAGGIAHDFNNKLAAILGNANLIKLVCTGDNKEVIEISDNIELLVNRTKTMSNLLLSFSGDSIPSREIINLNQLVSESVEFFTSGTRIKPLLQLHDSDPFVYVDKAMMHQVISNIVLNAIDSMSEKEGPDLQIIIGEIEDEYQIQIIDNGIGIEEKDQMKVFDLFFSTKSHGKGLGLSSVKTIMQQHGGRLNFSSIPGHGTTFHLYLRKYTGDLPVEISETQYSDRKLRILVVDDEDQLLQSIIQFLTKLNHYVEGYTSSQHAFNAYSHAHSEGLHFDLIVTDLTIKGDVDGSKLLQKIRKINPDAKAIVMSGYSQDPVLVNYQKFGFMGRILKPFTFQTLNELITATLYK